MQLTTSWQKAAEGVYEKIEGTNVDAITRLYLKYGNRSESNNRDTIYFEIRAVASTAYYGYGDSESYSIYDGSNLRANGSYTEGSYPSDPVTTTERVVASGNWNQTHNNDGTWSTTLTFNGHVYGSAYIRNISVSLPTINRYATVDTDVSNIKEHSVHVSWASNVAVDQIRYRLNSGEWIYAETGVNKTNGSYDILNLNSDMTYTIDFDYRRRDSQLWSFAAGYSSSENIITLTNVVRINVNGEWKKAVPYIKINNEWKKAIPYKKIDDTWKEGIN